MHAEQLQAVEAFHQALILEQHGDQHKMLRWTFAFELTIRDDLWVAIIWFFFLVEIVSLFDC